MNSEYEKYNEDVKQFGENYKALNCFVMNNTIDLCKNNETLSISITKSINDQKMISAEEAIDVQADTASTNIIISKKRSFEAASEYRGKKVAVLNFANNHSIGGSPWSAGAQEESICRCSTLFPCLSNMEKEFYQKHRDQFDKGELNYYGNDDMIYTPGIVIFKSDESAPKILEENEWQKVDIITSAAPQLFSRYNGEVIKKVLTSRIERIIQIAKKEGVEVLILGAYGCGAFHNPPKIVAQVFKEALSNYNFETVEFAIFCRDDIPTSNYEVFKEVFEK